MPGLGWWWQVVSHLPMRVNGWMKRLRRHGGRALQCQFCQMKVSITDESCMRWLEVDSERYTRSKVVVVERCTLPSKYSITLRRFTITCNTMTTKKHCKCDTGQPL